MRMIHIILKCFRWEEKPLLGQEKKEYIDIGEIFHGKIKNI